MKSFLVRSTVKVFYFQAIEENQPIFLKNLLNHVQKLKIEVRINTTQYDALTSCMRTLVKEFRQPTGITARQAVINVLEATHMVPGVFCIQMLSWRQRLHDILYNPQIITGYSSLQYTLLLSMEHHNGTSRRSIAVQTTLSNPNADTLLEFKQKHYRLQWVLYDP